MKKLILLALTLSFCGTALAKENSEAVFKRDFSDEWPLSFDRAVLTCVPGNGVFVINPMSEIKYPINGIAQGLAKSGRVKAGDLNSVWLDDPDYPGTKKSIGVLLDKGLELCD
ncbi:hypothetical protein COO59_02710 [Mixta theicola]|uniref:DUF2511 domain-containing protein n=1 Tax=Mixta theicola TaxID=1458355 RepID=A0A2K1QCT9_9GAMM|nr:DUF2511 domain-containing protein [Mixta theicola]PNS12849.1 hypothetical protein COO59_02710 [Mixta theicola]GLR09098.1 hypothetical protein GCM10007905_18180 [Mixta theicola]